MASEVTPPALATVLDRMVAGGGGGVPVLRAESAALGSTILGASRTYSSRVVRKSVGRACETRVGREGAW